MTHEELTNQGWIQTDGSCSTLQYAKKINETTWLYRQWVNKLHIVETPTGYEFENLSCEEKLHNWDDWMGWDEEEINLSNHPMDYIKSCLSTYGYYVVKSRWDWKSDKVIGLVITDGSNDYSEEDSIQLACECIFELEN